MIIIAVEVEKKTREKRQQRFSLFSFLIGAIFILNFFVFFCYYREKTEDGRGGEDILKIYNHIQINCFYYYSYFFLSKGKKLLFFDTLILN